MTKFDLSGKSEMNAEELEAQLALEAQLRMTQHMIEQMLTVHPHWGDDCGEYLRTALEISTRLMYARENGVEDLIDMFKELAKKPEGGAEGETELDMYACDGITFSVTEVVQKYAEVKE